MHIPRCMADVALGPPRSLPPAVPAASHHLKEPALPPSAQRGCAAARHVRARLGAEPAAPCCTLHACIHWAQLRPAGGGRHSLTRLAALRQAT